MEPNEDDIPPDLPEGVELIDVEEALRLADFKMPPPRLVSDDDERRALVKSSMARIWNTNGGFVSVNEPIVNTITRGNSPQDLWMLLLVRMITRVIDLASPNEGTTEPGGSDRKEDESMDLVVHSRQEKIRQILFEYIMTDFPLR